MGTLSRSPALLHASQVLHHAGLLESVHKGISRHPAQVLKKLSWGGFDGMQDLFLETHGVKLGFMSAFVKASADALLKVPAVNGVIDGDEIIYRDYTDISIAVATPKGLVVPVLRNVDSLSFAEVEKVSVPVITTVAHAQS